MRMQQLRRRAFRRIHIFTDRYPWLGPLIYFLSIEFFVIQGIVAKAWALPFSLRFNTISDLGATTCGLVDSRNVCSPLHPLMNLALIITGCTMAVGSLLIFQEFRRNRSTFIGFTL